MMAYSSAHHTSTSTSVSARSPPVTALKRSSRYRPAWMARSGRDAVLRGK